MNHLSVVKTPSSPLQIKSLTLASVQFGDIANLLTSSSDFWLSLPGWGGGALTLGTSLKAKGISWPGCLLPRRDFFYRAEISQDLAGRGNDFMFFQAQASPDSIPRALSGTVEMPRWKRTTWRTELGLGHDLEGRLWRWPHPSSAHEEWLLGQETPRRIMVQIASPLCDLESHCFLDLFVLTLGSHRAPKRNRKKNKT